MTILPDFEIRAACYHGKLLTPFDPTMLNPASIDVRLGDAIAVEVPNDPALQIRSIANTTPDNPFLLDPAEFILAQTLETFNVPTTLAGEFRLKSSRAREGLDQALAVWLDPGWHGSKLTVELRNNRRIHPLPLWTGMRIGQVIWHRMSSVPLISYAEVGHYNNDQTVQPSKGYL